MSIDGSAHEVVGWSASQMGGRLTVAIAAEPEQRAAAERATRRAVQRVEAWAGRLTRFSEASDLSSLNSSSESAIVVRPTLAATLRWAEMAREQSGGVVDPTLLDARLAAEAGTPPPTAQGSSWTMRGSGRASIVDRDPGVRFDLDGLAKGWLADRAADLLLGWPGVAVDADGDIALRVRHDVEWCIDVADPRFTSGSAAAPLATLRVRGGSGWTRSYGVATSGTSVHRWRPEAGRPAHHLIDPRTGRAAETDVVQATVIAPSAREAEVIAKAAVILGSHDALPYLDRSAAFAAILLLESGRLACLPGVEAWLA